MTHGQHTPTKTDVKELLKSLLFNWFPRLPSSHSVRICIWPMFFHNNYLSSYDANQIPQGKEYSAVVELQLLLQLRKRAFCTFSEATPLQYEGKVWLKFIIQPVQKKQLDSFLICRAWAGIIPILLDQTVNHPGNLAGVHCESNHLKLLRREKSKKLWFWADQKENQLALNGDL